MTQMHAHAMVSVIISAHNDELSIGQAIQSVVDQTTQPLEIVVLDDESTDRTGDIVRNFPSPIPIVYHRERSHGAAAARNQAVTLAKGNWVAFLDASGTWLPRKLAIQWSEVENNPGLSFLYTDAKATDGIGMPLSYGGPVHDLERLLFDHQPVPPVSTVLMQKNVFRNAGGFPSWLPAYDDVALYARLARVTSFHFIPQCLATYRRFHLAQNYTDLLAKSESWPLLLQFLSELWEDDLPKREVALRYLARCWEDRCKYQLARGNRRRACQSCRKAYSYRRSWKNLRRLLIARILGLLPPAREPGPSASTDSQSTAPG